MATRSWSDRTTSLVAIALAITLCGELLAQSTMPRQTLRSPERTFRNQTRAAKTDSLIRSYLSLDAAVTKLNLRCMTTATGGAGESVVKLMARMQTLRVLQAEQRRVDARRTVVFDELARRGVDPRRLPGLAEQRLRITETTLPRSGGTCSVCQGSGYIDCSSADCVDGRRVSFLSSEDSPCLHCNGRGEQSCPHCTSFGSLLNNGRGSGMEP